MAVSLGRSDVLGAQYGAHTESQRSRDFRGRFLPQNQRKIEFGLIRWAGPRIYKTAWRPKSRQAVLTKGIFGQAVSPKIGVR